MAHACHSDPIVKQPVEQIANASPPLLFEGGVRLSLLHPHECWRNPLPSKNRLVVLKRAACSNEDLRLCHCSTFSGFPPAKFKTIRDEPGPLVLRVRTIEKDP